MNLHTEEEARQMECPKFLIQESESFRPCIASKCMWWLWDMAYESSIEEPDANRVVVVLKRRMGEPKIGFCGAIGGR